MKIINYRTLSSFSLVLFLFLFSFSACKKDDSGVQTIWGDEQNDNDQGDNNGDGDNNQNPDVMIEVLSVPISEIEGNAAVGGGIITIEAGDVEIISRGICWTTSGTPTVENDKTTDGGGVGTFISRMSSLTENTEYFVRAYAVTSEQEVVYGSVVSFTTVESDEPVWAVIPILDVRFNEDGSAEDISPSGLNVEEFESPTMETVYNEDFERNIVRFNNDFGTSLHAGFYAVDYSESDNFKRAIKDGVTIEALIRLNTPPGGVSTEIFSNRNSAGASLVFMSGNTMAFMTRDDGKYNWANSKLVPEQGKYYHMVGVLDISSGKTRIYINGQNMGETNFTLSEYVFPSEGAQWFGIGGRPTGSARVLDSSFKGDLIIARIYEGGLGEESIQKLWNEVKDVVDQ